jgi:hypothetical protein
LTVALLSSRVTALLLHELHGLGGVGKTQSVVEYAYRCGFNYDLVRWIPAEPETLLRQSLIKLSMASARRTGAGCSSSTTPTSLKNWRHSCPDLSSRASTCSCIG